MKEHVTDDDHDVELPTSLALAWGVRERPAKGPKRGLSLDRIVAAAVKAADADGLEAVSMSRVAVDLGAAPMSLYRYVASKDELLDLMIDLATGQPPADPVADWRVGLTRWAEAYRAVLNRHDWILRLPAEGLPDRAAPDRLVGARSSGPSGREPPRGGKTLHRAAHPRLRAQRSRVDGRSI